MFVSYPKKKIYYILYCNFTHGEFAKLKFCLLLGDHKILNSTSGEINPIKNKNEMDLNQVRKLNFIKTFMLLIPQCN